MIVSLPFYDPPFYRDLTDGYWAAVAGRLAEDGVDVPRTLRRVDDLDGDYLSADLMLSQCCGWPFLEGAARDTALVGAQSLDCAGGGVGRDSSAGVQRVGETRPLADLRVAINTRCSVSGNLALGRFLRARGVASFAPLLTGGHLKSLAALTEAEADLAAIDCVYWHIARREGLSDGLEVIGWTESLPSPPYVTSLNTPPFVRKTLRLALSEVLRRPAMSDYRTAFGIADVVNADVDAYEVYREWHLTRA